MKIVKRSYSGDELSTVTVRIPKPIMQKLDRLSKKEKVTRQSLIAAILESALADKNLTIEV
ncbi:MAG: hypothetical protein SGJ18_05440 [Pseudomonadota bacterium]|nr:hypothetical protein [Pseudomonadota bacterium]